MDATLPVLVKTMAENRLPTPYESEVRALVKKTLAAAEWGNRNLRDANDELAVISERLALIESQLQRIMDWIAARDVLE